jgi:hypothetical protein
LIRGEFAGVLILSDFEHDGVLLFSHKSHLVPYIAAAIAVATPAMLFIISPEGAPCSARGCRRCSMS